MENTVKKSYDEITEQMIEKAKKDNVETVWDRAQKMQPQCGFGEMGVCCTNCAMGPCRITSSVTGNGPQKGICGANEDTMVARNLARGIAAGSAAHSDHGRDIAYTLLSIANGNKNYQIKDEKKLLSLASEWNIKTDGRETNEIVKDVAATALKDFGRYEGNLNFISRVSDKLRDNWDNLGITPRSIDRDIVQVLHSTHIGCDADYKNIMKQALRAALDDGWGGSMIGTELSDIMFGTPMPVATECNLSVIKKNYVNIIVHGHEPTLSEAIVIASSDPDLVKLAKEQGAEGINLVGMCCTGNELAMRHGIPMAGNFFQQELAIVTGAVDAMIVDVQCIMPSLSTVASCYHTKLITTSPKAKIPGAVHIEFEENNSINIAKEIIKMGVMNFKNRKAEVSIPDKITKGNTGYGVEAIIKSLDKVVVQNAQPLGTLKPLADCITSGVLRGAVAIVGCNNHKIQHNYGHVELAKELIKNDVLVVTTGCGAYACMEAGLMTPDAKKLCGKGLATVCELTGLPPVLTMGSCVDNSRILVLLSKLADYMKLEIKDLPVAGAAPEWMSEKAVTIGSYVVASGIHVLLGVKPFVSGSKNVVNYLTNDLEDMVGASFEYEKDPKVAAQKLIEYIEKKRKVLSI